MSNLRSEHSVLHRLFVPVICLLGWGAAVCFPAAAQLRAEERKVCGAGTLSVTLQIRTNGIVLEQVSDLRLGEGLLASDVPPFFSLVLRRLDTHEELHIGADAGWGHVAAQPSADALTLAWTDPKPRDLAGLSVTAVALPDPPQNALRWSLRVRNGTTNASLWRVVFPQLALRDLGETAKVFFPRGPGEEQTGVWGRRFKYRSTYPNGWCAMQFLAAYRGGDKPTGLYLAQHDPWGSTKDLAVQSDPARHALQLLFDHPAPDSGRAGNDFELSGHAVWQLLQGDWFDAARLYRAWVQTEARWWPQLGTEGRLDTPAWMRQLHIWAMGSGTAAECVPAVREFQRFFGQDGGPVGVHWYNWHQIPFDNDYPHYFPPKSNFVAGVKELREAQVQVMPYINGRLWDTHDQGADDFEFTRVAWPAVSKQEDGKPYTETYGSKETNGAPVRLGVMCPSTPLWQERVRGIVLRLLQEMGTSAVYIDQVAAAAPALCMDSAHGHPLGGGHWWNEGYWTSLQTIRQAMPPGAALTTECNAEPFIRWFDAYLTWHWQSDGQVPAFPAVYGGAIQMFGRAYRGGPTKDLALRMKAAQQLVFGEQIGWIDPGVIQEKENAEFLQRIVALRARLAHYFRAGEMARPPRLIGDVPKVKADWQWSGEWWVTTDAVLTGAWRRTQGGPFVVLLANVSDQTVAFRLDVASERPATSTAQWLSSAPGQELVTKRAPFDSSQPVTLPPRNLLAIEW
ncbi:MAG: DUF6259 domain-containing protein [Verrucomicrobiota bacterium]